MKFFRPHFEIATLAGEQDRLLSKIGGLPWGFPVRHWPFCCGRPEKLLAQLRYESPMLDLGAPGTVLHLFQCLECGGFDEGGHDVVLLPEADLGEGLTTIEGWDLEPELGNPLIGEFWIESWEERDDGIPVERLQEFFDEESYWALQEEFSEINWYRAKEATKFGGSPRWTGNGPDFEPPPFELLFQLDHYLFFDGPPPKPNEVGCGVTTITSGENVARKDISYQPDAGKERLNAPWFVIQDAGDDYHYASFTNLGSDGVVYVWIDRTRQPHEVKWFWRR